ncbi:MAG: hypothetical protein L3K09_05035 [Thermoplasmata archaeon]|nr:hypothetical protein [Thermoplasmata archaeon]
MGRERTGNRFWGRAGLTGGTLAVVVVMALGFSGVAAAHAHPAFTAPYKGTVSASNTLGTNGCASAKVVQGAHFKLLTGVGGFEDSAKANWCSAAAIPPITESFAEAVSEFQVGLKVVAPTTGAHSVAAKLSFKDSWSQSLTVSACASTTVYSACYQIAEVYASACGQLYDLTNGSIISASYCSFYQLNMTYNYSDCFNNTCSAYGGGGAGSGSGITSGVIMVNGTLISTHVYVLELQVYGFAAVESYSYNTTMVGTSSGAAVINFNTNSPPGNYAKLASVTVT